MSRTKIERRYRKMQADAKAFGAELLTEESIFIDDDHLDCVWYGGHIGGLRYKGMRCPSRYMVTSRLPAS